jgi:hypothetical protein
VGRESGAVVARLATAFTIWVPLNTYLTWKATGAHEREYAGLTGDAEVPAAPLQLEDLAAELTALRPQLARLTTSATSELGSSSTDQPSCLDCKPGSKSATGLTPLGIGAGPWSWIASRSRRRRRPRPPW